MAVLLFTPTVLGQTKEPDPPAETSATAPPSSPPIMAELSGTSTAVRPSDPSGAAPPSAADTSTVATPPKCCVHEGFYLRASSGYGYATLWGKGPLGSASVSSLGKSFGLAIGGAVAPGVVVAGTLRSTVATAAFQGGPFEHADLVSDDGKRLTTASSEAEAALVELGVLLDWYPNQRGGWHLGGSLGPGATAIVPRASGSAMAGLVWTGSVFGGYDFWMGNTWSAGIMAVASAANRTMLRDNDRHDTGYQLQPLAFGLEASFLLY